jgi:hypothetical protein
VLTPGKSDYRPYEVASHFSGKRVNRDLASSSNLLPGIGVKANAMNYLRTTIALAILLSAASVVNSQELPVITMRRPWCFGTCPIYSLEIFQDGKLHYNGEKFVAVIGPQEGRIPPAAVKALIESFYKIDYFDLKDVYETQQNPDGSMTMVSDLPTTYTSLRVGSRTKSVKDYAFSPEKLRTLELEIDRVANTHRWVHGIDDLKDWQQVLSDIYGRTKPGMTLLMQAAGKGDVNVLVKEHENGSDINAQDETGWTAIMLAGEQCRLDTVQQLLDWHAQVNIKDKNGDDALMGAASAFCYEPSARKAQAQIIKLLIANGADPNLHDDRGLTPLMALTTYGNTDAATILLDAGVQVEAKDQAGMTALDHAKNALKKYYDNSWTDELRQFVTMLEQRS